MNCKVPKTAPIQGVNNNRKPYKKEHKAKNFIIVLNKMMQEYKMVKCEKCKKIFDDSEMIKKEAYVGEFWGMPAYDSYYVCPYCKSDELIDYEEEEKND